jgi:hypothetical protein
LPGSIRKSEHTVRTQPGEAIQGDQILVECRKPGKWQTVRGSEQHHYFVTAASKNAYAVVVRRFTNVKTQ